MTVTGVPALFTRVQCGENPGDQPRQVARDQALGRAERRRPPVHVSGQRRRLQRTQPAGAEGADDPREDHAASGDVEGRPKRQDERVPGPQLEPVDGDVAGRSVPPMSLNLL